MNVSTIRLQMVREAPLSPPLRTPDDVRLVLHAYCKNLDREHFIVLLLDTRNRCTGLNVVSIGTLNSSLTHPREVFKAAIVGNAAAVILAHNHPSGDATPSHDDREITKRLCEAGKILGIDVLDHMIVADCTIYSMRENGEMP